MSGAVVPLTAAQEAVEQAATAREGYFKRVLVAFDIFGNVVLNGLPDETISSRSARAALRGNWIGIVISRFLDLFQPDHGANAIAGDVERAQTVLKAEESTAGFQQ